MTKKSIVKILPIILAVILLGTFLAVMASAEGASINVEHLTAKRGDTVTFSAILTESVTVGSGSLALEYEEDVLELVGGTCNVSGAFISNFDVSKGKGAFAFMTTQSVSGTLFTVTFNVKETASPGTTDVSLNVTLKDGSSNVLALTNNKGSLTVSSGASVQVENLTAVQGDTVSFNATLTESMIVGSGSLALDYEEDVLELVGGTCNVSGAFISNFDVSKGKGAFAFMTTQSVSGSLFTVTFKVKETAPNGIIAVSLNVTLKDGSNNELTLTNNPGSVKVGCDHTETKEDTTYIKSAPTCVSPAVYYKSCALCGLRLEETFEYGAPDPTAHSYNEYGNCELHDVKISGAAIALGTDLSMNYYVSLYNAALVEDGQSLAMSFTMDGKNVVVTNYDVVGDKFVFPFEKIPPQAMTCIIDAELLVLDGDGAKVKTLAAKNGYSLKENAEWLLDTYSTDEYLVQLVTDILFYGAAAQNYKDFNNSAKNLANAGITTAPDSSLPTEEDNKRELTTHVEELSDVYFESATVWFDNVNKIGVKLSKIEGVSLKVNGEYVSLTATTYYTEAISAFEFDKIYTFELYEGETLVQTLTYSVNSYIYVMAESENTEMADLAIALYRYGKSAGAYKNA